MVYTFFQKISFQGGTFKRCECESGLKPSLPDPATGIIKRCIGPNEAGVLSLISQAKLYIPSTLHIDLVMWHTQRKC
mgnify:CR=1 FL=1